jgi:hypothetical protein
VRNKKEEIEFFPFYTREINDPSYLQMAKHERVLAAGIAYTI